MRLWQVDIHPADGQPDSLGHSALTSIGELGIASDLSIRAAYGFLLQGALELEQTKKIANELLSDPIAQRCVATFVGDVLLNQPIVASSASPYTLIYAMLKPGVMDPVAQSTLKMLRDLKYDVDEVRTFRKYWISSSNGASQLDKSVIQRICQKVLANDSIEHVVVGPLALDQLAVGSPYKFQLTVVPIRDLDGESLLQLSKTGQLYLSIAEMNTVQEHFREQGRDPTDIELETIAQTWSEHCSHKTLGGKIEYRDENGTRHFKSMLKETIFAATVQIRESLGPDDWCVSVFKDNAGVVKFDDEDHVVFKVETHNHPSAIEPYGGANTGLGGVIRDPLGTGLGAKPICSTDVF